MNKINWHTITINQYFILQKELKDVKGQERALRIACSLHNLDIHKERLKGTGRLLYLNDSIKFFGYLPMDNPKCTTKIGGKEVFFKPLASITSGEFIDIQAYEYDKKLDSLETTAWQIARLCASKEITALEKGDGYKSTEIVHKWHKEVLKMSMADFCSLASFFLNKQKNSRLIFLLYFLRKANEKTKMELKEARLKRILSVRFFLSFEGLRLRILEAYLVNYRKLLALRFSNLRLSLKVNKVGNEL